MCTVRAAGPAVQSNPHRRPPPPRVGRQLGHRLASFAVSRLGADAGAYRAARFASRGDVEPKQGTRWLTCGLAPHANRDRKSTRLNSSHPNNSYAVFFLKKKKNT